MLRRYRSIGISPALGVAPLQPSERLRGLRTRGARLVRGVTGVPVTHFVVKEGDLAAYGQGRLGVDGIRQGIEMAS